jgi:hypothetical protein
MYVGDVMLLLVIGEFPLRALWGSFDLPHKRELESGSFVLEIELGYSSANYLSYIYIGLQLHIPLFYVCLLFTPYVNSR